MNDPFRRFRLHRLTFHLSILFLSLSAEAAHCLANDIADARNPANARIATVSKAEQLAFAVEFEQTVEEGDDNEVNDLIGWSELLDLALVGEKNPEMNRLRQEFKTGFLQQIRKRQKGNFSNVLIESAKNGGSFKFLRLAEFEGEPVAIFRLKNSNQAVNYHQYFLKKSKDGLVRAHDMYVITMAERISETVRRSWLPVVEESTKSFWQKLTTPTNPNIAMLKPLTEMNQLIRDGQAKKALAVYDKLPELIQKQKLMQMCRLHAAQSNLTDEEYSAVIDDFRRFFPKDPALDFFLIDGYLLKKEYEKSLECIDRTIAGIGEDSWLIATRGNVFAEAGRFEEARKAIFEAIELEPDFKDIYLLALSIAIQSKNNEDIANHLMTLELKFELEFDDLTEIPEYADFVKSPEYQKWMESRE